MRLEVKQIYVNRVGNKMDRHDYSIHYRLGIDYSWESILTNELTIFIQRLNSKQYSKIIRHM